MARITIEDCLDYVDNMYDLVLVAAKRTRQLYKGSEPMVKSKNRHIVTALREIGAGEVTTSKEEKAALRRKPVTGHSSNNQLN